MAVYVFGAHFFSTHNPFYVLCNWASINLTQLSGINYENRSPRLESELPVYTTNYSRPQIDTRVY